MICMGRGLKMGNEYCSWKGIQSQPKIASGSCGTQIKRAFLMVLAPAVFSQLKSARSIRRFIGFTNTVPCLAYGKRQLYKIWTCHFPPPKTFNDRLHCGPLHYLPCTSMTAFKSSIGKNGFGIRPAPFSVTSL